MTLLVTACEALEKDNPSLEQRRMAHLVKLVGVTSACDVVTNPDPYASLLDLVLMVTLQSQVWIDDAMADDVFRERADELVRRLRRARVEVWELAARVLTLYYFVYFLIILPLLGYVEKPRPLPRSISESVLRGDVTLGASAPPTVARG